MDRTELGGGFGYLLDLRVDLLGALLLPGRVQVESLARLLAEEARIDHLPSKPQLKANTRTHDWLQTE
jgi:hypothetical protein